MNILLLIPAMVWLILSALFFAGGEFLSKLWGINPNIRLAFFIVIVYAFGTITWLPALLHKNQLALMGTLWLLLATVATVSIGIFVFHEHLSNYQIAGIILSLLAMTLLNF